MKGSMKFTGEVIEYLPDDFPWRVGQGKIAVMKAINDLTKQKVMVIPSYIMKETGLGRTTVQTHLTSLMNDGVLTVVYAKVHVGYSTTIAGVYSPKKVKNTKAKKR